MIPNTPALILQTDHTGTFLDRILKNNNLWNELSKIPEFGSVDKQLTEIQQFFHKDSSLLETLKKGPALLTAFSDSSLHHRLLFLFPLQKNITLERVKAYLQKNAGTGTGIFYEKQNGYHLLKVLDGKNNRQWYLGINKGVLVVSRSHKLLTLSLNTDKKGHFTQSHAFRQVARTTGTIVDASLYLYYPHLIKLLAPVVNKDFEAQWDSLSRFALWTEADILIKNNQLLLSGYTNTTPGNLLSKLKNQQPQTNKAYTVFPFDTRIMLNRFYSDPSEKLKDIDLSRFPSSYRKDIARFFEQTRQAAYVSDALSAKDLTEKSWAVLAVNNVNEATEILKRLAVNSHGRVYRTYGNATLRRIKIPGLLTTLYGNLFPDISEYYYTVLNGYVIFGRSEDALIRLIGFYDTGKTLDLNDNFTTFTNTMASKSNLSVLIQPKESFGLAEHFLTPKAARILKDNMNVIDEFPYLGFQWINSDSLFYTNISLRFSTKSKDENLALWKLQLEDPVVGKPFLVKDHETGKYDIIVFDSGNRMYLINSNGKILWTKRLPALPISSIYSVDYYKNRKYQYLFNTENNLYLIDRNGQFVANYPIRIVPKATNGLTLFDYNRNKDYRILVAQADKKVYDYNIKGNRVRGWLDPKMQDIVTGKIYRLLANHRDYIFITDLDNHIKIVSRRGKERIYLKGTFEKAKNSAYYVNKTNNKGIILTTDTKGELVYISSRGHLQYTRFGTFTPDHYFLYNDFNGDGIKDFIYIDQKKLTVYNRLKKVLFEHTFSSDINIKPEFFSLGEGQKVLGVVVSGENTIYLFDKNGNILVSKGLTGSTPFTVGSLNDNRDINLISASGNTLYNYRIK
ncbi:MAG: hypothetical protein JXR71_05800 [Bacteroidales bacterium]|nr:hypothetical protein [Bacteroidales bacterium]